VLTSIYLDLIFWLKIHPRLSLYFHTPYKIFQTKTWRLFLESKRLRVLQQSSILLDIYTTNGIIYSVKNDLEMRGITIINGAIIRINQGLRD
jgi:hypothetical protein